MTYVYLLQSLKTNLIYIGATSDLRKRVKSHKDGLCRSTKKLLPVKLIYYEAFLESKDAWIREKSLKQFGGSYRNLMKRLTRRFPSNQGGAG